MELLRWCRLQWDRLLAVGAMAAGIAALVLGWAGASNTEYVAKQIPYAVSGGLGCLVLVMIGGTLWLSADLRDEWRSLDRLEDRLAGPQPFEELVDDLRRRLERLERIASRQSLPDEAAATAPGGATAPRAGVWSNPESDDGARR